jgi:hypothetical protein
MEERDPATLKVDEIVTIAERDKVWPKRRMLQVKVVGVQFLDSGNRADVTVRNIVRLDQEPFVLKQDEYMVCK